MADTPRRKVGDKDPNFEKDKARAKAKAERVAAQAPPAAPPAAVTPPAKRSVLKELRDAIDELVPREATHGGRTVDEVVDEAIGDANTAPRDY